MSNLASPARSQISYLEGRGIRDGADELALEFDDLYPVVRADAPGFGVTRPTLDALEELDAQLNSMSGPNHVTLWSLEALSSAPEWTTARRLAAVALSRLQGDSPVSPEGP